MLVPLNKLQDIIKKLIYFSEYGVLPNHEVIKIESNINLINYGSIKFRSNNELDLLLVSQILHDDLYHWDIDYTLGQGGLIMHSRSLIDIHVKQIREIINNPSFVIIPYQL